MDTRNLDLQLRARNVCLQEMAMLTFLARATLGYRSKRVDGLGAASL